MVILRLRRPKVAVPQSTPPTILDAPILDMLNRDQRTAITIDRTIRSGSRSDLRYARIESLSNASEGECSDGPWGPWGSRAEKRPSRMTRLTNRLGEVFIVGVCLLTLVRVPGVMSAPSTRHTKPGDQMHPHNPTESSLSYLHPCGKSHEVEMNSSYFKPAARESDPYVIKHIIIRTKNTLDYAESFRERYVQDTFLMRFDMHHAHWAKHTYHWLPDDTKDIPKRLGQNVNALHLTSHTFNEFLINMYEYLQKFAVGLEQIVIDQKRAQGKFQENFRMMEVHLRSVLCEIREAMMERNISPREPVPRSIMTDEYRKIETVSQRNVRDWIIFRDLMNGLEYVIQVLSYFDALPPSGKSS